MQKTKVKQHFDKVSEDYDLGKKHYSFYYQKLKNLLKSLIPNEEAVFEIGCGTGDLLASLNPKDGFGMDLSSRMIKIAAQKYKSKKNLVFSTNWPKRKYKYLFMSDVIEHLEDPEEIFEKMSKFMDSKSLFVITMANPLWEPILIFWEWMGWKMKEGPHKRLFFGDIKKMLSKEGLKVIKHDYRLLIPIYIPFLTNFINKHFEGIFRRLAFIEFIVVVKA